MDDEVELEPTRLGEGLRDRLPLHPDAESTTDQLVIHESGLGIEDGPGVENDAFLDRRARPDQGEHPVPHHHVQRLVGRRRRRRQEQRDGLREIPDRGPAFVEEPGGMTGVPQAEIAKEPGGAGALRTIPREKRDHPGRIGIRRGIEVVDEHRRLLGGGVGAVEREIEVGEAPHAAPPWSSLESSPGSSLGSSTPSPVDASFGEALVGGDSPT